MRGTLFSRKKDKGIPPEKEFTREELQKAVDRQRKIMFLMSPASRKPKVVYGKEMYLDTNEGRIRVLGYNMEEAAVQPVYVNIHGGGFNTGFPETDDKYMKMISERLPIKIINVDYSLAPEAQFPKAMNECYAVVEYLREHAEELHIDADRIAIGGHSAGGNLGAAVILKDAENKLGIKGLIVDYAPMDVYTDPYLKPCPKGAIPPQAARIADPCYCHKKEDRKNPLVSPAFATTEQVKHFPPSLVITASQDSLCPEGEKFKDTLIAAGIPVTFKRFEGEKHGFTHYDTASAGEAWDMMVAYLGKQLCE